MSVDDTTTHATNGYHMMQTDQVHEMMPREIQIQKKRDSHAVIRSFCFGMLSGEEALGATPLLKSGGRVVEVVKLR